MELYYTVIPEKDHAAESQAARKLLKLAYEDRFGAPMPEIITGESGKPFFRDSQVYFSLSHSSGHILVGLGDMPMGVDIELDRDLHPGLAERLFSPAMRRDFTPLEGWTLREAVFKISGSGSLRKMEFSRSGDVIIPPMAGVVCRLYHFAGCTAAAASTVEAGEITAVDWERVKKS